MAAPVPGGMPLGEHLLLYKRDEWTLEDFLALPDEDGRRYEIEDGCLVVSPMARTVHQRVVTRLMVALTPLLEGEWEAIGPVNLGVGRSYRIPDLVIARRTTVDRGVVVVEASDILLVVEVVSSTSRTRDRVTKRAEYAAGGIPHYWTVEHEDEARLDAYTFDATASEYRLIGTWSGDEVADLREPVTIRVVPATLV